MIESAKNLSDRWSPQATYDANALLEKGGKPISPFGVTGGRADFRGLTVSAVVKASLKELDLSWASFLGFGQLYVPSVTDCRFDSAVFETNLGKHFIGCSFVGARLKEVVLRGTFEQCSFAQADLSGAKGAEVVFQQCDLSNVTFRSAHLIHSRWEGCCFEGARFHNGSLRKARFIGEKPSDLQLGNTIR